MGLWFVMCSWYAFSLHFVLMVKRYVERTIRTLERNCTFCMKAQKVGPTRGPSQKLESTVLLSGWLVGPTGKLTTLMLFIFALGFAGQTIDRTDSRTGHYLQLLSGLLVSLLVRPRVRPTNHELDYLRYFWPKILRITMRRLPNDLWWKKRGKC